MESNYDKDHMGTLNDGVRSSYNTMIWGLQDLQGNVLSCFDTLETQNGHLCDSVIQLTRQQQTMASQHNAILNQMPA